MEERSVGLVCLILLCEGESGLRRIRDIGNDLCLCADGERLPENVRINLRGEDIIGPSIVSVDRFADVS
jgi:hypothetical protein